MKIYSKFLSLSGILFCFAFLSCSNSLKLIKNNHFTFIEQKPFTDTKTDVRIKEFISAKKNENLESLKYSVVVFYSDENVFNDNLEFYCLTNLLNLSDIYEKPCSGYYFQDDIMILIYSKKHGYINPINYPKPFLESIRKRLIDNWTWRKTNCEDDSYSLGGIATNHADLWEVKNDVKQTKKYYQYNLGDLLYGKKDFSFTHYYDLNNFRVEYPKGFNTK